MSITLSWLGGFFDGEGSVSLVKKSGNSYVAFLSIPQSNKDILVGVRDLLGVGTVHQAPVRGLTKYTPFLYKAEAKLAAQVADAIIPFTVIKQRALVLVRDFQNHYGNYVSKGTVGTRAERELERQRMAEDVRFELGLIRRPIL